MVRGRGHSSASSGTQPTVLLAHDGRWRLRRALQLLGVALAVYVPFAGWTGFAPASLDQPARVTQLNQLIAYSIAILGLTVVTGWSGQISLGQSAFVGLGAYCTVILVADHDWSYVAALLASASLCGVVGLVIGLPVARMRGMYLGVVTLCLAFVFPSLVRRFAWLTGGVNGKGPKRGAARLLPPDWLPMSDNRFLARPVWVYCLSLVIGALVVGMVRGLRYSRVGRALLATRDGAPAAQSFGVAVHRYRAAAFGVSAACGGICGSLLMMGEPFVTDRQYEPIMAIFLVVGLVVGGAGTPSGAVLGAAMYLFVPYFVREWSIDQSGMPPGVRHLLSPLFERLDDGGGSVGVFFGLALILCVFLAPGGLSGAWRGVWVSAVRRRVSAGRRGDGSDGGSGSPAVEAGGHTG